jgi:hypothetical protein
MGPVLCRFANLLAPGPPRPSHARCTCGVAHLLEANQLLVTETHPNEANEAKQQKQKQLGVIRILFAQRAQARVPGQNSRAQACGLAGSVKRRPRAPNLPEQSPSAGRCTVFAPSLYH